MIFLVAGALWLHVQAAEWHPPPSELSTATAQAYLNKSLPAHVGPQWLAEAESALQKGKLRIVVPKGSGGVSANLPASDWLRNYPWDVLQREFKTDFPSFDLQLKELDHNELIKQIHLSPKGEYAPDIAFVNDVAEFGILAKASAVVGMWGRGHWRWEECGGCGGWWVVFRQTANFAAAKSFMPWLAQSSQWKPWRVNTNLLSLADVAAVQELSQKAVEGFLHADARLLGSVMDSEAARSQFFRFRETKTLHSIEPLIIFGNARLAFVLLAIVGEDRYTFGMIHEGVVLRNNGAGWKVLLLLPDESLLQLEDLFKSCDRLGLEEAAHQAVPKVMLLAPENHAHVVRFPRPEIEWATSMSPVAAYIVESQSGREMVEDWSPSSVQFVSPDSHGPAIRMIAPFGSGMQPHRWRVWAVGRSGVVSISDWRIIDFKN